MSEPTKKPAIELSPARAICARHGEPFRARWPAGIRGEKRWCVGVMVDRRGWEKISEEPTSYKAAFDLAKAEAARLDKPLVVEQRPRRLWY